VAARAAKPVVQVEMAERGVKIVEPHQAHDPSTKPNAFGISGRTVEDLGGLDEFVGLALAVLGGIGRTGGTACRRLLGLILGAKIAALGNCGSNTDQECEAGDGETTQNRIPEPKQQPTHKVPDLLSARACPNRGNCTAV
jgi:hypothetical protein